jgi:hypothetical protein
MIETLTQNILQLNLGERNQLFKMLSDNATILIKVIPNAPLLEYIVNGHTDNTNPIIQAYTTWKNNN